MIRNHIELLDSDQVSDEYTEEEQSTEIRMQFVNQLSKSQFKFVALPGLCRDYLTDILFSEYYGEYVNLFGFHYNPKKYKIDRDATKIGFTGTWDLSGPINHNIKTCLHPLEKTFGWTPTKVYFTEDTKSCVTVSDPKWITTSFSLSWFTELIRVLSVKYYQSMDSLFDKNIYQYLGTDRRFFSDERFKISLFGIPKILKALEQVYSPHPINPTGWTLNDDISKVHSYSGLLATINSQYNNYYINPQMKLIREYVINNMRK